MPTVSPPPPLPTSRAHLIIQPSTQAFSARSFLDSTMSCDVTETNSRERPANMARSNMAAFSVRLLQLQQVAENQSLKKEKFLCACHCDKQGLGFLNKDPQNQVLFNWSGLSGLSRAATCIRRTVNVFLQFVPMNLCTRSSDYGMSSKPCNRGNNANVYTYCQNMLRYGISGHL